MPPLVTAVRRALRDAADPVKAPQMQAYMKSSMPYRGVSAPEQKRLWRDIFAAHSLDTAAAWRDAVLELWREAGFREERYAAIALASHKRYAVYRTMTALPLFEELIVTGAWWDYVDPIATRPLGELLRTYPVRMKRLLRRWARADDMWQRRAAILAQLHFKHETDLALLYDCIEPNLDSREFFLRKAIGWALRQHAWTDAREVQRYVHAHRDRLSPLSVREALKNVGPG